MRFLLLAVVLSFSSAIYAEALPPASDAGDASTADARSAAESDTHPTLSTDATWAGSVLIGIAGFFVAAMVVGPMVRAEAIEQLPPAADHADHHAHHH
jgi:hypothetical protein